jgi:hypothetical protein
VSIQDKEVSKIALQSRHGKAPAAKAGAHHSSRSSASPPVPCQEFNASSLLFNVGRAESASCLQESSPFLKYPGGLGAAPPSCTTHSARAWSMGSRPPFGTFNRVRPTRDQVVSGSSHAPKVSRWRKTSSGRCRGGRCRQPSGQGGRQLPSEFMGRRRLGDAGEVTRSYGDSVLRAKNRLCWSLGVKRGGSIVDVEKTRG